MSEWKNRYQKIKADPIKYEEYLQKRRDYQKRHRQDMRYKHKKYREKNKAQISARQHRWYLENKERLVAKAKYKDEYRNKSLAGLIRKAIREGLNINFYGNGHKEKYTLIIFNKHQCGFQTTANTIPGLVAISQQEEWPNMMKPINIPDKIIPDPDPPKIQGPRIPVEET